MLAGDKHGSQVHNTPAGAVDISGAGEMLLVLRHGGCGGDVVILMRYKCSRI